MNLYTKESCQAAYGLLADHLRANTRTVFDLITLNRVYEAAAESASVTNSWENLQSNLALAQDLTALPSPFLLLMSALLLDVPRDAVMALQLRDVPETLDAYNALRSPGGRVSGQKAPSPHWDRAVLLACAKVCRQLRDSPAVSVQDLHFVQDVLIPAAEERKIRYYARLLRNDTACDFVRLQEHVRRHKSVCSGAYQQFDALLGNALSQQELFSPLNEWTEDHSALRCEVPFWAVAKKAALTDGTDCSTQDLWEVFLSYAGKDPEAIITDYLQLHRTYLAGDLTVQYIGTENNCVTFRLTDKYENSYLLNLLPRNMVHSYFFGTTAEITSAALEKVRPAGQPEITVYIGNDNAEYRKILLPAGATALDLAFYASPTDAVMVRSARIHQKTADTFPAFCKTDLTYPLDTILRENDTVIFDMVTYDSGCGSCAAIDWFSFIRTAHAQSCLIQYLKERYT